MASYRDYHNRFGQASANGHGGGGGEPSSSSYYAPTQSQEPPEYSTAIRFSGDQAGAFLMRDTSTYERRKSNMGQERISREVMMSPKYENDDNDGRFLKPSDAYEDGAEMRTPDTPSAYTDPFEYGTVIGAANGGISTAQHNNTGAHFLTQDPYAGRSNNQGGVRSGPSSELDHTSTLGPDDSISAYRMKTQPRQMEPLREEFGQHRGGGAHSRGQPSGSYNDASLQDRDHGMLFAVPHRGSVDVVPKVGDAYGNGGGGGMYRETSTGFGPSGSNEYGNQYGQPHYDNANYYTHDASAGHMDYADDEEDEKRRREHYWNDTSAMRDDDEYYEDWDHKRYSNVDAGPALLSNNMLGPASEGAHYAKDGRIEDDKRGLLSTLKSIGGGSGGSYAAGQQGGVPKPKPGWGGAIEDQIARRRAGLGRQRWPYLSYALGVAYVAVFIVELIKAKSETGQAIQTKPSINPMIGPPYEFLIAFGARFVPCMREMPGISLTTPMVCLKDSAESTSSLTETCPLYEICGLPNATTYGQSWRFIAPIFVHAGFVHIAFNLLAQLTICAQMEKIISTPLYALVFVAGGLGGNLLGGNFGLVGLPSVGASGAIYACISLELVDLLYNWKHEYRPKTRLVASIVFTIIGFGIGLLPGIDNFAHIGGFAVGILGGLMLGPSIHETRRHYCITWILRFLAAAALVGYFVGLSLNFYNSSDPRKACTWCRYLSCLPVFSQCKGDGFATTSTSTSSSS